MITTTKTRRRHRVTRAHTSAKQPAGRIVGTRTIVREAPTTFALGIEVWIYRFAAATACGFIVPVLLGLGSFWLLGTIDMIERLWATGSFVLPAVTAESLRPFAVNLGRWAAVIALLMTGAHEGTRVMRGERLRWVVALTVPAVAWIAASAVSFTQLAGLPGLAQYLRGIGL